uniref:Odorant receptor 3 n=1 Tax=Ips typographus TaxID=55986 RepID=M3UZG1_IPSTY
MPTRNLYPFDASQGWSFWILFVIEAIFCYHTCCVFTLATVTLIGFLKHILAQLRYCGHEFETIFDGVNEESGGKHLTLQHFIRVVKYHQEILRYTEKVFSTFNVMIVVYTGVTSFILAITGFQITSPETGGEDKIRYTMLIIGWALLFYWICYYGQQIQDEASQIADAIYNSKWYENTNTVVLVRRDIIIIYLRTKRVLDFKVQFLGAVNMEVFVAVMRRAYQIFTLLLSVT